jgi:hypothetical protein
VAHAFTVGQMVTYTPPGINVMPMRVQIVRQMPPQGREPQYRVRGAFDGIERACPESELALGETGA